MALSLGLLMASAGIAVADTARADGNLGQDSIQAIADLGTVAPGAVASVDIGFVLTCTDSTHMDAGQTVTFALNGAVVPLDGDVISVGNGSLGSLPVGWPVDGAVCDSPAQAFSGGTPSVVTLRAPTVPGRTPHPAIPPILQSIRWRRPERDPPGDRHLDQPRRDHAPGADAAGGFDRRNRRGEHDRRVDGGLVRTRRHRLRGRPGPDRDVRPDSGIGPPLGPTTVACEVTDAHGLAARASFDLTVVDTSVPTLAGVPADQSLTTGDPTGTTLTYTPPTATDVADANPVVGCLPTTGSHVGPGATTVTCTATDASGNASHSTFAVDVVYVALHEATARWGEPVAGFESAFTANRGRTSRSRWSCSGTASCGTTGKRT